MKEKETVAQANHLRLDYGSVSAVKDVSFQLVSGEILAIVGPNGAGKTSAVECLEGLRRPSAGTVRLLGLDPYVCRKKVYREVGIQLQTAEYPEKIKVKEICRLFSSFYEHPADWKQLLERFDLAEKAGRCVQRLSGGEKQRLSILLALLPRPKVLVLDELTTGLDPEVRRVMWDTLEQIKNMGTSILLVSHYLDEVERLADRLVYMENGCSAFEGTQAAFREYAAGRAPSGTDMAALPLEEVYLLLSPRQSSLHLEDVI